MIQQLKKSYQAIVIKALLVTTITQKYESDKKNAVI